MLFDNEDPYDWKNADPIKVDENGLGVIPRKPSPPGDLTWQDYHPDWTDALNKLRTAVGSGGGPGDDGGGDPFDFSGLPSRPSYSFGRVPAFTAPQFTPPGGEPGAFNAPQFNAPTAESYLNDPSYQFRLSQGQKALENSAAARGVLNTGATLKDILGYGQQFASQEYGNIYDRALQAYDRQYKGALDTQNLAIEQYQNKYGNSLQAFDRLYQGAKDMYTPQLLEWQTNAAAQQRAADLAFQRAWDQYVFGHLSAAQIYQGGMG